MQIDAKTKEMLAWLLRELSSARMDCAAIESRISVCIDAGVDRELRREFQSSDFLAQRLQCLETVVATFLAGLKSGSEDLDRWKDSIHLERLRHMSEDLHGSENSQKEHDVDWF